MKAAALAGRLEREVLLPIAAGGKVRTGGPFGRRGAMAVAQGAPWGTPAAEELRSARLVAARRLAPLDALSEPSPAEWALAAALHDLLLATDPELGEGRFLRLLRLVEASVAGIPPAVAPGPALERWTTFAGVVDLFRNDTEVEWWAGSARFSGVPVPERFTAWASVRRVRTTTTRVELGTLAPTARREPFLRALRAWLAATPLLALHAAARGLVPPDVDTWAPVLASDAGARLAARLARTPAERSRLAASCRGEPVLVAFGRRLAEPRAQVAEPAGRSELGSSRK